MSDSSTAPTDPVDVFTRSLRRSRRRYAVVLAVLVAVAVSAFSITVARGEISHVTSRTATSSVPAPSVGTPGERLAIAWQSSDATALGAPLQGGTVVTYSEHVVTGRDSRTGTARWSFSRTDRSLCSVVQESGKTVALYSAKGNCDQVTTLDTATGARIQERTLDDDGNLVSGTPTVIPSTDAVMLSTDSTVRSLRLSDGLNSWTYVAPAGCQNAREVRGSAGVLISQHCTDGDYLLLRDLYAGDKSDQNKVDPVKWRIRASGVVPLAADSFVAALDSSTRKLLLYNPASGARVGDPVTLTPSPSPLRPVLQTVSTQGELIWIGDTVYSVNRTGDAQQWSTPALTLPTFSGPATPAGSTDLATLAVPTLNGIAELDPSTGLVRQTFAVATPAAASRIIRLSTGFVIAEASTTVYK